ncbi:hypothetical protein FACS1894190_01750 [Spirochaetia bacterium]|nr:hypothetical protein FACS1894190_01750 [Spirochaetia bacterium]
MAETIFHKRLMGVVVSVGSLRGSEKSAVGEFVDLIEFSELAEKMGLGLIQLLPVNDTGYESSPYSALSAFALNPIYLKVGAMAEAAGFEKKIQALNKTYNGEERFPYYKIAKAKIDLLREIFTVNRSKIEKEISVDIWIKKNTWVKSYAVFRRLKEANDEKSWKDWKAFRKVSVNDIEALWNDPKHKDANLFWVWIQYHLDKQFSAVAEKIQAKGIILKGDLPILLNEDSCDVWANPEYFHENLSAGAPPDMYNPDGQNWGFPLYNWYAQQKDNFAWWRARLAAASKYFGAYRIDHVLGFFRIWACSRRDDSALLGRYVPYNQIKKEDLYAIGFDDARINWISVPHIPTGEVWEAVQQAGGSDDDARRAFDLALDRIGNEELWWFKKSIHGEKDIVALELHDAARNYLCRAWANRILFEYDKDTYSPLWYYSRSRAWNSFNDDERANLEAFLDRKKAESEKKWEIQGKKLLSVLVESSTMLACAEDLGATTEWVPRVLQKLKILSLKVFRWEREWDRECQPFIPISDYPELAVCTTSVHDSTTLRQWWEAEADHGLVQTFLGQPSLPKVYNPGTARLLLKTVAAAPSRFRIFPLVDFLHLTPKWYAQDPASERINIPGSSNDFNWTWRIPAPISEIAADGELLSEVKSLSAIKPNHA